jgi:hypothetical protein
VLLRSRNSKKNEVTKPIVIYATMATKDAEIAMIGMAAGSISIMAPSDMPGGYEFFADAGNGSSYKVRVVRKQKKSSVCSTPGFLMPAGCLFVGCCSLDPHHRIC